MQEQRWKVFLFFFKKSTILKVLASLEEEIYKFL